MAGTANTLEGLNPDAVRSILASGSTIEVGGPEALSWASEQAFAAAVQGGWLPSGLRFVMYDPEDWPQTPLAERELPVQAMAAFARLAHAAGYHVILTPHPNLTLVPGGSCTTKEGETQIAAFLRCGLPEAAARLEVAGDVVDLQFQSLEADTSAYRAAVEFGVRQVGEARTHATAVAELSTHYAVRVGQLSAAWRSVRGLVGGYYLAVPNGEGAQTAATFLSTVEPAR